jgi:hypothetical protein
MNRKNTWVWFIVAALLFAVIVFERSTHQPDTGPAPVLSNLKASAVTNIQVFPAGQLEIRAERTNAAWQLTKPIAYPAQAAAIDSLLAALEQLTPATSFSAHELRQRPKPDEEFGFDAPQTSLVIQPGDYRVKIGRRTMPGNQVYLQVVGVGDVFVVDADWLKLMPKTATDWRDTSLVDLRGLNFDRLIVTNGANSFELQREAAGNLWRMTWPLRARADNVHIEESLQKLQTARVVQFVPDEPKPDLEALGLQPADLTLAFNQGTNRVALLEFGRSPTNDASLFYARQRALNAVVAVTKEPLMPWRARKDEFRDPHIVTLTAPFDQIEIRGEDNPILQRQGSNSWRIAPDPFPVDTGLVNETLNTLAAMRVVQFANDVLTEADLPRYGLRTPTLQIILRSALTNAAGPTNLVVADLSFGTNQDGKVFVRRADEDFIYEVAPAVLQFLPAASWQLRERRIWSFTTNQVSGLTIHQGGKAQQLVRNGPNQWSVALGSQGTVDTVTAAGIEETVRQLGDLSAVSWLARGPAARDARFGFKEGGPQITVELSNGGKLSVEFGGELNAAITLDGQTWVFRFPPFPRQLVSSYLTIPANAP